MPEQIIIGWDLETVPDLAAAARMLDLGNAAEADVRQALGSGFPKLTAIRIATIANRATSGGKSCSAQATHWLDLVTGVELCCFSVERAFLQLTLSNFKAALLQRRCRHLGFLLFRSGTDMTRLLDHTGELASLSELNSAASLPSLASDECRAPTAILSSAKRAALIACLNGGSLHKRCGVWAAPSASVGDKPISGVTVADLGRDGMLMLSILRESAHARLTARGNWFARTVVTELAERAAP